MLWANGGWGGADDLKVYAEANGLKKQDLLKELKPGSKLWMYDSREGRWRKQMGEGPMPLIRSAGLLEYIPDWKKSIWFASNWNEIGMWTYDAKANTWAELKPNGGRNFYHDNKDRTFPGAELQGAYSSRHKKLVAVKDTRTWLYDLTKNEWSRACDDPENDAHDARSVFAYDDVNDVFLLQQPHKKSLRAFRITTNKWETLQPKGAGLSSGKLGYFDSARNAFVIHQHDRVWVYRYKTAAK